MRPLHKPYQIHTSPYTFALSSPPFKTTGKPGEYLQRVEIDTIAVLHQADVPSGGAVLILPQTNLPKKNKPHAPHMHILLCLRPHGPVYF